MGKSSLLSVTHMNMYCDMVERKFKPLIGMLEKLNAAKSCEIETQVKKDFGIYDLVIEKKALEVRLAEVKSKVSEFMDKQSGYRDGNYRNNMPSQVEEETKRRMDLLNEPLMVAKAERESMLDQIKLATAGAEVKAIFERLEMMIAQKTEEAKSLLPPGTDMKMIECGEDED